MEKSEELKLGEAPIRSDKQRVLCQLPRNTWQVLSRPCEDIPILTEEVTERAFLFLVQPSSDDGLALREF